jgi:hypothetical protein
MEVKIAKHICFLLASIFLLVFIAFNSCKKIDHTKTSTTVPHDTTVPKDSPHTEFMKVTAVLMDSAGKPLSNVFYTIIPKSIPNDFILPYYPNAGGWTDSLGNLNTVGLTNTDNVLTVYKNSSCSTVEYSKSFHTLDTNINLGTILIRLDTISTLVSGTIFDCNNNSLKTGIVIIEDGIYNSSPQKQKQYKISIKTDGTFSFALPVCNKTDSVPVIMYAEDASGLQMGNRLYFSLHSPENKIEKITACSNTDTTQFLKITLDSSGYVYPFVDNPNSHPEAGSVWTYITGQNQPDGELVVNFGIDGVLAVGKPGLSLVQFDIEPNYSEADSPPVVAITEDGPIGGYIAGIIKLKLESLDTTHSLHDASCSFRVRRKQ